MLPKVVFIMLFAVLAFSDAVNGQQDAQLEITGMQQEEESSSITCNQSNNSTNIPTSLQLKTPGDQIGPFYLPNSPSTRILGVNENNNNKMAANSASLLMLNVSGYVRGFQEDSSTPATNMAGCGRPVIGLPNITIEVWYAGPPDAFGNFYQENNHRGQVQTDECGRYQFTQVFPALYPERPILHDHFRLSYRFDEDNDNNNNNNFRFGNQQQQREELLLVTQLYFAGNSEEEGYITDEQSDFFDGKVAEINVVEKDVLWSVEFDMFVDKPQAPGFAQMMRGISSDSCTHTVSSNTTDMTAKNNIPNKTMTQTENQTEPNSNATTTNVTSPNATTVAKLPSSGCNNRTVKGVGSMGMDDDCNFPANNEPVVKINRNNTTETITLVTGKISTTKANEDPSRPRNISMLAGDPNSEMDGAESGCKPFRMIYTTAISVGIIVSLFYLA